MEVVVRSDGSITLTPENLDERSFLIALEKVGMEGGLMRAIPNQSPWSEFHVKRRIERIERERLQVWEPPR